MNNLRIRHAAKRSLFAGASVLALISGHGSWAQTAQSDQGAVENVVITGTLLKRKQEDMATPVITTDSDQLQQTGTMDLGDLGKFIPQNIGSTGGVQDLQKGGTDGHDARSANLRGLGAGATLVLLNGRRVVPAEGYVNLDSLVPTIDVQRVETVLGGASATYGADAVAGVINVITDKHFEGFDATTQYTNLADANDYQLQARIGAGGQKFHSVVSLAFTHLDRLQNGNRRVTNFFNGSSGTGANPGNFTMTQRPQTSSGGDVIINGNDYSTLYDKFKSSTGSLIVVDPNCGSAATGSIYTPAANAPGFGLGTCTFSYQAANPLRPGSNSILAHMDAEYDLTDDQNIYFEFAGYHQDSERWGVPSFAQNHNAGPGPVVPASNPYNPFGVPVQFSGRAIGSQGLDGTLYKVERDELMQFHTVAGTSGKLPFLPDWNYDANLTWSRASTYVKDKDTDMQLFQDALNGYGGPSCNIDWNGPGPGAVAGQGNCMYLSPFAKDDEDQNPALLYNIQTDEMSNVIRDYEIGEMDFNGPLFDVWGGTVQLAVGAQYRREFYSQTFSDLEQTGFGGFNGPTKDLYLTRSVRSFYAEADIPLVENLDIDVAGRYENYGRFHNLTPKVEANYKIIPGLLSLRGSYSTAFQAPTIQSTSNTAIGSGVGQVTDPLNGVTTFRTITTQGNPNLQPQKDTALNFGFTVLPIPHLSFSADYWSYDYQNQILTQNAQAVINANPNGPQVIRDSNGVAQTILVEQFNAPSGTQTSGVDLSATYTLEDVLGGTMAVTDTLTYLTAYDIDTGSLVYNGIGRRNATTTSPSSSSAAPRIRNFLNASWTHDIHSLNVDWRYSSSLYDDYNLPVAQTPTAKIAAWSVFDWQYRLLLGENSHYEIDLGMLNAMNSAPGFAKFTGYLPSVSDALGRQTYLRLGVHF
ncbi:MAG TPA: TonB-dependent receptor [Rhizomicrobium sp.]|nr:TonB-dependent receptor [Rhizomicrobium sp.]